MSFILGKNNGSINDLAVKLTEILNGKKSAKCYLVMT